MPKGARLPAVVLDPVRVDAWRVRRQLLIASAATTPEAVAEQLVGVQAQVQSSANLSIAIREQAGRTATAATALAGKRLVRTWAMRGTLHAFSATDFPTIAASLTYRETWRSPVWLRYFKVTESEMEQVIEAIGEVLDDGQPRTRTELAAELGSRLGPHIGDQLGSSWGTFLKPAATAGVLIQGPPAGQNVTYVRPDRWLGHWRRVDPDEAILEVFRRYLAAYGPASSAEILRWWGVQQPSRIRPHIERLRPELTEVEVDGTRALALTADLDPIAATNPEPDAVQLLGPFDPFIVGAGLRERLIPKTQLKRVSRTSGWISPVVLVGGRVVGVWDSKARGDRVDVTVDTFETASTGRWRAIADAATRVGDALGVRVTVTPGPVFLAAPSLEADATDS